MNSDLQQLIDLFLKILHLYSIIGRKPKDYGTGDLLYFTEVHTITVVGKNDGVNMTRLAEIMGVTKGAISQTIRKLVHKNLIVKTNNTNRKEINLKLSGKGRKVLKAQASFQKEIFSPLRVHCMKRQVLKTGKRSGSCFLPLPGIWKTELKLSNLKNL